MPKHVAEFFDSPGDGQDEAKRTKIINNAFDKVGGKWTVNWDKPFFKEAKARLPDMDASGNSLCLIVSLRSF